MTGPIFTQMISLPTNKIINVYMVSENIGWLKNILYPFEYENTWSDHWLQTFAADNLWIPFLICAVYYVAIFGGQSYLKDKQPYDLKKPLALWNLSLAVFSMLGVFRTIPQLVFYLYHFGYTGIITQAPNVSYGSGPSGVWTTMFIFSKFPELFDTAFIVLRKKPLIFLHWYHHITVLLYCWHAYATAASTGLFFVTMNYTVHSVMYFYYYAMAVNKIPKWFKPIYVTIMQISQMIAGVAICSSSIYYKFYGGLDVQIQNSNLVAGALMYASYLYLFCEFFYKRFMATSAPKKSVPAMSTRPAEAAHESKKTQ